MLLGERANLGSIEPTEPVSTHREATAQGAPRLAGLARPLTDKGAIQANSLARGVSRSVYDGARVFTKRGTEGDNMAQKRHVSF
jgi:hypothetical protein